MSIYDSFKDVIQIARQVDNIELIQKVLHLQAQMQEMHEEALNKEGRIQELEKEVEDLEQSLKLKGELIFKEGYYYKVDNDGEATGYPFCSRCWEIDHILITLQQSAVNRELSYCPECGTTSHGFRPLT